MQPFILAIDQGTTGTTCLALTPTGRVAGRASSPIPQFYPKADWVEHDPDAIWRSVSQSITALLEQTRLDPKQCAGIGLTNQRETVVVWKRETGEPVYPAIVWQDRRTTQRCEALADLGHGQAVKDKTGLIIHPYFSALKIAWVLEHVEGARQQAEDGVLVAGTVDAYLIYRLTGGKVFATDATNASRTMLYNIQDGVWDEELCALFGVPLRMLPEVKNSSHTFGRLRNVPELPDGIPIGAAAGDQHAALFGQSCFERGEGKCTYGTGAFLLFNTGSELVRSKSGLLSTVAWQLDDEVTYALEGSALVAGALVQWLRDALGIIESSSDIEALASQVEDSQGVIFVPAFAGLGAPYWDPRATGVLAGLTRATKAAHIARAALEGMAMQIVDLVRAMEHDAGYPIQALRVDGGAAANDLLMQLQCDMLGVQVRRPEVIETTALGVAFMAGLTTGVFTDKQEIKKMTRIESEFNPILSVDSREEFQSRWKRGVALSRSKLD